MENTSSFGGFGTSMPDGNAPLWAYVTKIEKSSGGGGNMSFKCNYCQKIYKGSYSRVKTHLLRIANVGIKGCPKVTAKHKLEMQKLQDVADQKKISKKSTIPLPPGDGSESISSNMFGARKRKLTGKSPLERAFNNSCKEHLTSLIARMFYSGGIPFHFAKNPHYVNSYKYAANNMITGYVPLGYNALRTTLLQKERVNVEKMLKPIKDGWKEKGAIDGIKEYKDKYYISKLLMNVIKEIGPEKVVQVITDNTYVMKAAGSLIEADEQWTSYNEDDVEKATRVRDIILDDLWWDRVDYIILFTSPIYDMLRAADTDKPTLHLVYDMWDTMIEKVKTIIFRHEGKQEGEVSTFYNVVYDILIDRWTKNCTPLHCMAHSLNPKYYSTEWLDLSLNRVPPHQDFEISEERNKCLERYFLDNHERTLAKTEFGKFSRGIINGKIQVAMVKDRSEIDAIDWWQCYGAYFPKLQSIASKFLVQPCDSWEDPYGGAGMLEIASLTLDELELEEEVIGATSVTVGSSAPADSGSGSGGGSVGDEDDEEDVVVLG
uniref:BED-type domain-containing protein n=1 Tax=Fagus sylvatica TaxID=28930 RepID=A0A2N9ETS1_FAGSY